jgi:hypothetical protein
MKIKLLFLITLLFCVVTGYSQNTVTYSTLKKTIDLNSGVEGVVDILVNCYGSSSSPVFLNTMQSCGNNDGILSSTYTNGNILSPGGNTTLRYKFKKTVTANTQIVYKFSTDGSCFQEEKKMIIITVNYKSGSTNPTDPKNPTDPPTPTTNPNMITFAGAPYKFENFFNVYRNETDRSTPIIGSDLGVGFSYQWFKRMKFGDVTPTILIKGANGKDYLPADSEVFDYWRRTYNSSTDSYGYSNVLTVNIIPAPALQNNTITLNGSTIYGSLPTGGINEYQYSWVLWGGEEPYTFPQTGQNFELTKDIYDYLNLYPNLFINRIVTSGRQTITSTRVKILPLASLENNTISISGSTITGSQPTGGNNSYQYSWMLMGGEEPFTFADTGKDFEISVDTYNYLNSYPNLFIYRTVTSGNKTSGSNSIVISPAKEIGNNIITLSGNTIEGSLPTGGTGGFKYEHYIYHELPDGEVVDGVTVVGRNQSYQGVIQGYLTTKFYRKVYSGNKISTSNTITILPKGSSAKTAIASEKSVPTDVTVYPNPTTQSVNFTTNFSANKEIEITIFSEGLRETKSIFRGTVTPNQVVNWNFPSNYPKGLYFYKIMADNKEVKSGKISFQ